MRKNHINILLSIMLIFLLGACAKKPLVPVDKIHPQTSPEGKKEGTSKEKLAPENGSQNTLKDRSEKIEVKEIHPITNTPGEKRSGDDVDKEGSMNNQINFNFEDIYFDYDKFSIKKDMQEKLKSYAKWLKSNLNIKIRIEGHCDERGTAEYNLSLGEKRVNAIKKYLVSLGADAKAISTISYGEEQPVDPGHNEEAWRKNRRGHFKIREK